MKVCWLSLLLGWSQKSMEQSNHHPIRISVVPCLFVTFDWHQPLTTPSSQCLAAMLVQLGMLLERLDVTKSSDPDGSNNLCSFCKNAPMLLKINFSRAYSYLNQLLKIEICTSVFPQGFRFNHVWLGFNLQWQGHSDGCSKTMLHEMTFKIVIVRWYWISCK